MTRRAHLAVRIVRAVGMVALALAATGGFADEKVLSYDDGMPDGKRSIGGAGHAVVFQAPAAKGWYVTSVDVMASRYGGGYDPDETFADLYICDHTMKPLSRTKVRYSLFSAAGEPSWVNIEVAPVEVPEYFQVLFAPGSLQYRGLYVACDGTNVQQTHSQVANATAPGKAATSREGQVEWMIHPHITDAPKLTGLATAEPEVVGELLKYDDGTMESQQSIAGTTGEAVYFIIPEGKRVLDRIHLFAGVYGTGQNPEGRMASIFVRDAQFQPLAEQHVPYSKFTSNMDWVVLDIPDVEVSGPFYVVFVAHSLQTDGIYLGIDETAGARNSLLASDKRLEEWTLKRDRTKTRWMVRAELKAKE